MVAVSSVRRGVIDESIVKMLEGRTGERKVIGGVEYTVLDGPTSDEWAELVKKFSRPGVDGERVANSICAGLRVVIRRVNRDAVIEAHRLARGNAPQRRFAASPLGRLSIPRD